MQSWLIVIWIWSVVILFLLRWRLVWFRHFVSSCAFVFLVGFCFQVCHQPISSFHPLCPVQVFLVVSSVSLCLVPSCYFVFLSCYYFFLMFVSILSPCFVCHSGVFCCYFKFFLFFLGLCVMFDSLSFSCFPAFFGGCGGRVHNHHALMTDDTKSYCLYKCFTLLLTVLVCIYIGTNPKKSNNCLLRHGPLHTHTHDQEMDEHMFTLWSLSPTLICSWGTWPGGLWPRSLPEKSLYRKCPLLVTVVLKVGIKSCRTV